MRLDGAVVGGAVSRAVEGLREFLSRLEERGELLRIRKEVDPRFEVAALIRDIQQRRNRAIVFERVKASR